MGGNTLDIITTPKLFKIELGENEITDLCLIAVIEKNNPTKVVPPIRNESMKRVRHEKKLGVASEQPKRLKPYTA